MPAKESFVIHVQISPWVVSSSSNVPKRLVGSPYALRKRLFNKLNYETGQFSCTVSTVIHRLRPLETPVYLLVCDKRVKVVRCVTEDDLSISRFLWEKGPEDQIH